MHTQTDTATAITTAGGDYVFTVKGNQPTSRTACKRLPIRTQVPAHAPVTAGPRPPNPTHHQGHHRAAHPPRSATVSSTYS